MYEFQFESDREREEHEAREWARREVAAFRRRERLDLEWARISYGVALVSGSGLALGVFSTASGIFGLWAAFLGAWFLDRHLVAEVVERSVSGGK